MNPFTIIVDFRLKPGARPRFTELVLENAAASVRDEPGCRRFDVLTPLDGADERVVLYEIYDDRAAFDAHLQTPHYFKFRDGIAGLVERQVREDFGGQEHAKH